jgi:hypothetical protein
VSKLEMAAKTVAHALGEGDNRGPGASVDPGKKERPMRGRDELARRRVYDGQYRHRRPFMIDGDATMAVACLHHPLTPLTAKTNR